MQFKGQNIEAFYVLPLDLNRQSVMQISQIQD
jgi:hypothetical protein